MTDFDFSGPHPNVQEAGKRPRSSMAPTIALKNGKPAFSIGSPGGSTIITTVLQTIVNHVDLGMPMDQAVNAPRISERNGDMTDVEPGFAGSTQARALEQFGHKWTNTPEEIGAANALVFNRDGTATAVSEAKRHGVGTALVQQRRHSAHAPARKKSRSGLADLLFYCGRTENYKCGVICGIRSSKVRPLPFSPIACIFHSPPWRYSLAIICAVCAPCTDRS